MSLKLENVLITDQVDPKCVKILESNGVKVVVDTGLAKDKARLIQEIPKYDGLIVRSATKVTADVIESSNLSIIGRAGTGTDNIDANAATKKGVIVMNTPGGNTISAAELTCAMVCALSRNIGAANMSMKEGRWDRKLFMGEELQGKTLAIVGLGRIGREVGSRMRSFGMKTIGYDPFVSAEQSAAFDVTSYPLEELWPLADYITVHVPLIPSTKNMINAEILASCRPGVKIVNCARGGIIDEAALLDSLNNKHCGGAGLDVYAEEPPTSLDLVKHPNVVATPHLGASTKEAQSRVAEEIAQQFIDSRDGKSLFGAINANAMVQALSPESQPLVALGRGLGAMVGGVARPPCEVTLSVSGDEKMKKAVAYLQAAVSVGLMTSVSSQPMNLINAPSLAKEAGFTIQASHSPAETNSVSLSFGDSLKVSGKVEGGLCVITEVNGAALSAVLMKGASYVLLLGVKDVSAAVGHLFSQQPQVTAVVKSTGDSPAILAQLSAPASQLDGLRAMASAVCKFSL